jgi:hypothetical protein
MLQCHAVISFARSVSRSSPQEKSVNHGPKCFIARSLLELQYCAPTSVEKEPLRVNP